MPRKARQLSSTGIYHVMLRSVNQQIIFEEDADYLKFLFILADTKAKFDVDIYAYCLMDNHVHILISSSLENLASFFQSFGTRFVHWYNDKYMRFGHLFQERFHSVPVTDKAQFFATIKYIHKNPVKAGMCRFPFEYRWSSYKAFFGEKNALVNVAYSYDLAGTKKALQSFFSNNSDEDLPKDQTHLMEYLPPNHGVTDEQALSLFRSISDLTSTHDVINFPKSKRNDLILQLKTNGLSSKQISRLLNVSVSTVKRICS